MLCIRARDGIGRGRGKGRGRGERNEREEREEGVRGGRNIMPKYDVHSTEHHVKEIVARDAQGSWARP